MINEELVNEFIAKCDEYQKLGKAIEELKKQLSQEDKAKIDERSSFEPADLLYTYFRSHCDREDICYLCKDEEDKFILFLNNGCTLYGEAASEFMKAFAKKRIFVEEDQDALRVEFWKFVQKHLNARIHNLKMHMSGAEKQIEVLRAEILETEEGIEDAKQRLKRFEEQHKDVDRLAEGENLSNEEIFNIWWQIQ